MPLSPRRCATEARGSAPLAAMASLFERQRADVESRLDAIVRGGEPVTSRLLASLQGALGLDGLILDDEGVPRDAPGSDTRVLVEHALCRLTQRVMQEETERRGEAGPGQSDAFVDDDDRDVASRRTESRLDRCLDLALALSETGFAEPGSVFVAVEQVFEASTVEECARVFSWVERARERLSDEALWKRGKLTMLRTCNDLARRLSKGKTSDVVLRGRVSLLLAALYPLSERSALNISGAYNDDENRRGVDERLEPDAAAASGGREDTKKTKVLAGASASVDEASSAVDAAFYRTFWNLQVFFRDPPSTLGAGPTGWSAFRRSLEAVLAAFETHQLDRSAAAEAEAAAAAAAFASGANDEPILPDRARGGDSMDADDAVVAGEGAPTFGDPTRSENASKKSSGDSESAGVTYLTAAPLLRLQLRDAAFRRHFLTQCAVFLNHRDDIAPTIAAAASGALASGERSGKATGLERRDGADAAPRRSDASASERKTRAEAEQLRRRVFRQLGATPPAGAKFAEAVSLALRRERHWTRWKRENCRAFERAPEPGGLDAVPPPEPEPSTASPAAAGGRARARRPSRRPSEAGPDGGVSVRLGHPELDRLWNLPDDRGADARGAAAAGEGKRKLEALLRRVHEDADPEAEIEEPYKRRHDAAFRWRLTRLLAAEDLGAFVKLASEDLESVAAEALGLPPWPEKAKPAAETADADEECAAGATEAAEPEKEGGAADDAADAADDAADDAAEVADAGEEKKKRVSSVMRTKTGGGEHTRFAPTPGTTDEFRGDSDMGSDSDGRDLVAEVG